MLPFVIQVMARLAQLAATCAVAAVITALTMSTPAAASCVGPPSPLPYRFTGTVTSVQRDGLIAQVRTDNGRQVVVRGTPPDNETGVTSVDRHFAVGVRYEFHPLNNGSPFQDNACTATKAVGGTPAASGGNGKSRIIAGGLLLIAAALATGWWLARRRNMLRSRQPVTHLNDL